MTMPLVGLPPRRGARGARRSRLAVRLVALTGIALGCADYEGVIDPAHGLPDVAVAMPQFGRDVLPIIERRCAIGGCHSILTHQGGLVLVADSAHRALVNQPSRLRAGEVLVRPGDAMNSWMAILISDDVARRSGYARMPLGSGALTPNQVTTIRNWINRGAPND
jgi:hypothetical protein